MGLWGVAIEVGGAAILGLQSFSFNIGITVGGDGITFGGTSGRGPAFGLAASLGVGVTADQSWSASGNNHLEPTSTADGVLTPLFGVTVPKGTDGKAAGLGLSVGPGAGYGVFWDEQRKSNNLPVWGW